MIHRAILKSRGVIAVDGPEARACLQGMITQDIEKIDVSGAIYTALLTPQGRFLHDFFIISAHGKMYVDCHRNETEELISRFKMYKLRRKATFENVTHDWTIQVQWSDTEALNISTPEGINYQDPRWEKLGVRTLLSASDSADSGLPSEDNYQAFLIAHGIPDGRADMPAEKAIILEYGLQDLGAISWTKGCYMGQELMARTYHRGEIRKRTFPVIFDQTPDTTEITSEGEKAGRLLRTSGHRGLAMVYVDKRFSPLFAGAVQLTPAQPEWMQLLIR